MAKESTKHENIIWNPATQLWFCAKCGQTSGQVDEKAAQFELEQRPCYLPWVDMPTAASNRRSD